MGAQLGQELLVHDRREVFFGRQGGGVQSDFLARQAGQHVHAAVAVHGGENAVTGAVEFRGKGGGVVIANFAQHEHVGVHAQVAAQGR